MNSTRYRPVRSEQFNPGEVYSCLELKKIIDSAQPGFERTFLMTAIFTGLRHGELCGLQWSTGVDLKHRTLRVTLTQLSRKHGGPRLETPKSRKGFRQLEIPADLAAELTRWKLKCPPNRNDLIFVSELGRPLLRNTNNLMLRAVCKRAGVRPLSVKNLRHSFASQQLIGGTTPLEVSYMMGHSSVAITLRVYAHWVEAEPSQAQTRLANRIMNAGKEESRGHVAEGDS